MELSRTINGIEYFLSNENLQVGDNVFPMFEDDIAGFPDSPSKINMITPDNTIITNRWSGEIDKFFKVTGQDFYFDRPKFIQRPSTPEEIEKVVQFKKNVLIEINEEIQNPPSRFLRTINNFYNDIYTTIDNISPNYKLINVIEIRTYESGQGICNQIENDTYLYFKTGELCSFMGAYDGVLAKITAYEMNLNPDDIPSPSDLKQYLTK